MTNLFAVGERDLTKRVADYSTQVSMAHTRISYGNIKPKDVLAHLSSVCSNDLTGCNYQDTDALTIASEMYVDAVSIPISGHLTLNPKGVFAEGNGSQFVDCVVKTASYDTQVSPFIWQLILSLQNLPPAFPHTSIHSNPLNHPLKKTSHQSNISQCETKSWNKINPNPKSPAPKNSVGTASFCTMSNFIECARIDKDSGDPQGSLQVGISFTADPGSSFDFCSLLGLAGSLSGVLGPFFGVASFACSTASGK